MKKTFVLLAAFFVCVSTTVRAEIVYTSGHADLGVGFETVNGVSNLKLHIHAEGTLNLFGGGTLQAGEYEPGDLVIGVPGPSVARPSGTTWDFLASSAGAPIWFLPQSDNPNKPFLGIGTEELVPANGWTGATPITFKFNSITPVSGAPSAFALYQTDQFGAPTVQVSTLTPMNPNTAIENTWSLLPGGHDHFVYAFTAEGVYDVSLTVSGRSGSTDYTDTTTFRFATGSAISSVPEPSSMAMLAITAVGLFGFRWRRMRRNGLSRCDS